MLTLDPTVMAECPPYDEPDQADPRQEGVCVACLMDTCPVCDDHGALVIELL